MRHLFLKNINTKKYFIFALVFMFFISPGKAINNLNKAWFHPYDPSLIEIAEILTKAKFSIDIAMYSMNIASSSPVIKAFLSESMQKRIKSSQLKVRLIFQGYKKGEERAKNLQQLENIGIDVKYFSGSKKLHHKFAVIDGHTLQAKLITGSANWSLSSYSNYSDNIIYFANTPRLSQLYQNEFNFLWTKSQSFGVIKKYTNNTINKIDMFADPGIKSYFNSSILNKASKKKSQITIDDYILTRQIVNGINAATKTIIIASTRIKLFPIYTALMRAADRGVKIKIIVTQAQYEPFYKRERKKIIKDCQKEFSVHCSIGVKYSSLLERASLVKKNIEVRVKFFDLRPLQSIQKQMHHKYILIDDKHLLTGSFNWSFSSEFQHIENLLSIDKNYFPAIVFAFKNNFNQLWVKNRQHFSAFYTQLKENFAKEKKFKCHFKPMVLSYLQIDEVRKVIAKYKRKHKTRNLYICL